MLVDRLKSLLEDPPPAMAFEISEAGIAAARIGSHTQHTQMEFQPLKSGTLAVSPLKENVIDPDDFALSVRAVAGTQTARKRRDVALILPDFCTRIAVLDFDSFPSDAAQQLSLIRFRSEAQRAFRRGVGGAELLGAAVGRQEGGRGGGFVAAGDRGALRGAVPGRRNASGTGDPLFPGGPGAGAGGRPERLWPRSAGACSP